MKAAGVSSASSICAISFSPACAHRNELAMGAASAARGRK
jgi:hypothetical protein